MSITNRMRKMFSSTCLIAPLLVLGITGCSDFEGPRIDQVSESNILTRVVINTESVIMKLGDSINLSAKLFSINGSELTGVPASRIQWSSSSSVDATVDSTGKVKARRVVTAPISIVAKLEYNGTTKADTIPVYITATSYNASQVRIIALDSTRVGAVAMNSPRVRIDIYDNDELVIKGARIHVESSVKGIDITYAGSGGALGDALFSVRNTPAHIGPFFVKVKGNLYGTEISDSVEFTGLYTGSLFFNIGYDANSGEYRVGGLNPTVAQLVQPCAIIMIMVTGNPEPVDLIFSDSTSSEIDCDPNYPRLFATVIQNIAGGNLFNIPIPPPGAFPYMQRRSGGVGIVEMRVRLSGSKKLVGPSVRFDVRTPDQLP